MLFRLEGAFKKAITVNPENEAAYIGLGRSYKNQGRFDKAEEMLRKAFTINPENERLCGLLAVLYEEMKKDRFAEEYFGRLNRRRLDYYKPMTRRNYRDLKEIVNRRGIRLVCVQYPMRSVEPLKKMLKPHKGVIFVDNESLFKRAVRQEGYDEYFIDRFGGDFGHCTLKGYRFLAKNIADVILKDCFNEQ